MTDSHQPAPPEESPIEEYSVADLEAVLEKATVPYYCVDALRDPHTKRKLIDPRSVLSPTIVRNLYESWGVSRDKVLRVTRHLDAIDQFYDIASKTVNHYANQIYRYLMIIFTQNKPSYKAEVQGLATCAAEMLEGVFGYDKILETSVGPSDLRPVSSYYDHLVNVAIYWLATTAHLNRRRAGEVGAVEVWRSKNKEEMSRITDPRGRRPELMLYYDYYGWERAAADLQQSKKGDLSLVISGFFGALFHDVAFLPEPKILISLKGRIDEKLKNHVDVSNRVLKEKLSILADERPLTRNIIKNHHEFIDGSGYPSGKKEKDLHLFVQILSVCDLYDEYSTQFTRGKVIRLLSTAAGRSITGEPLRSFFSILRPYDPGELLDVYEGKKHEPVMQAEVLESDHRIRPKVKIVKTHDPDCAIATGDTLDLAEEKNIIYFI